MTGNIDKFTEMRLGREGTFFIGEGGRGKGVVMKTFFKYNEITRICDLEDF